MLKKLKFKPEIIRIKLNPEQAVLSCSCYSFGRRDSSHMTPAGSWACINPSLQRAEGWAPFWEGRRASS